MVQLILNLFDSEGKLEIKFRQQRHLSFKESDKDLKGNSADF